MWITALLDRVTALVGLRPIGRRRSQAADGPLPRGSRGPMRVAYESAVVHDTSSWKSRLVQRGARLLVKPMLRVVPFTDRTIEVIQRADARSARRQRPSKYTEPVRFELGGVLVESLTHRYGPDSDMTILYLHGGGFFSCGIDSHRRVCERLARKTGATVISVEYVQLPHGTVADSVDDAITAYAALLEMATHPDKIVVAGDSAGGYLTMKIAELAKRRGLQAPAALLGFSPLLSMDPDRLDKDVKRVVRARDAYLPISRISRVRSRWLPEGVRIEGEASPLDAVDVIDSPTFLVAAEDEILRPEVEAMALALSARGVEVETHLWRGQVHAFPVLAKVLPESDMALQLAADFARRAVGELDTVPTVDQDAHTETISGEVPDDATTGSVA